VGVAVTAGALAGCSSANGAHDTSAGSPSPPAGGAARVGALSVTDAIVPAPASPYVAAAYFTITNQGNQADQLVRVTSDVSAVTGLHDYRGTTMVPLATLAIPARATVRLAVGSTHVMIENPTRQLAAGQTVELTLIFGRAGSVRVDAPVVAGTGPTDDLPMSPGMTMSGMTMPGMS
jgi:copper(I)-binding protein